MSNFKRASPILQRHATHLQDAGQSCKCPQDLHHDNLAHYGTGLVKNFSNLGQI